MASLSSRPVSEEGEGEGEGEDAKLLSIYKFPFPAGSLKKGDFVFAQPKGRRDRAGVCEWKVLSLVGGGGDQDRVLCGCTTREGAAKEFRRSRLVKIICPPATAHSAAELRTAKVLVCFSTAEFRTLANSQVRRGDRVVEIGASTGETTFRLARAAGRDGTVIGLECSESMIAEARRMHPQLNFQHIDALMEKMRLLQYCAEADVLFIDVGGDRSKHTVVLLLSLFLDKLPSVRLIVIKCEELVADLDSTSAELADDGRVVDSAAWLGEAKRKAIVSSKTWGAKKGHSKSRLHPLGHARRFAPDGVEICRFHNFRDCLKLKNTGDDRCPLNHAYCHFCLARGHRAKECVAFSVGEDESGNSVPTAQDGEDAVLPEWRLVARESDLRKAAQEGRGLYVPPFQGSDDDEDNDDGYGGYGGGGGSGSSGGSGGSGDDGKRTPRWAPSWGQRQVPKSEMKDKAEPAPAAGTTPALAIFMDMSRNGAVYAIEDRCPHAGHRMSRGDLFLGDIEDIAPKCGPVVACPAHAFTYDLRSGLCLSNPREGGRAVCYSIKLQEGGVWVGTQLKATSDAPPVTKEQADQIQLLLVGQALDRKYG